MKPVSCVALLLISLSRLSQSFSLLASDSVLPSTSALRILTPDKYAAVSFVDSPASDDGTALLVTEKLQAKLISYGASYNRGFGASSRARQEVNDLVKQLEARNKETFAARGISPGVAMHTDGGAAESPLTGAWRMVWTTALDVLSLEANPFATTGAIYQVFDPPVVTNVIDFLPRFQSLLPPSLVPSSLLRANVHTEAYERLNKPNRIGLEFQSVQLQPIQALGLDVKDLLPPLGLNLPRLPGVAQSEDGPGYFDVTFLDDKFLIIRQQGDGFFCLVKVDSVDP